MQWLRRIGLRWFRLIIIVVTAATFLSIAYGIDRTVTPRITPERFTIGALIQRPGQYGWAPGFPRVFVRYLDQPPTFGDTVVEWITGHLVRLASGKRTRSRPQPPPSDADVVVTGADSCEQHKPHSKYATKDEWEGLTLQPFGGGTDRAIHYVTDAPAIEKGTASLPGPSSIDVVHTRISPRKADKDDPSVLMLEIHCALAIKPQRASYSQYRMQFDTIFRADKLAAAHLDYPTSLIISPPSNSTDWRYEGGIQREAPLKFQPAFTNPDGLIVAVGRDDHVRSDFPSKDTLLSPSRSSTVLTPGASTVRVTWTYDDAASAREFSLLIAAAVAGVPMLILYELIKGQLPSAQVRERVTRTPGRPGKKPSQ